MTLYLREDIARAWQGRDPYQAVAELQGQVYRDVKGRRTLRFELAGRAYFVKHHKGVGWLEVVKNLLQLRAPVTSAENEWRAIRYLQDLGLPTMELAGYGKRGATPAGIESFIITDALENTISLEELCEDWQHHPPPAGFKRRLIMELARFSRTMHENGICHRDFYLCHFLLHCDESAHTDMQGRPRLSLIDLHRALISPRLGHRWIEKDIAGLYFSALHVGLSLRDRLRFVRHYSARPLRRVLKENGHLWQRVQQKAEQIARRDRRKQARHYQHFPVPPTAGLRGQWIESEDGERKALLQALITGLARHHSRGSLPADRALSGVHVDMRGELLIDQLDALLTPDGAAVSLDDGMDNSACFLAWFPAEADEYLPALQQQYLAQRGLTEELAGSPLQQSLRERVQRRRSQRWRRLKALLYADSHRLRCKRDWRRFAIFERVADGPQLQRFLAEPDACLQKGRMIKDGDSTTVVALALDGQDYVVKRYNITGRWHALQRLFRPSRAWHCWRSAHMLLALGLHTARPVLMLERRFGPLRGAAYYVSELLPGEDVLRSLSHRPSDSAAWSLALTRFGVLFRVMRQHGIVHGDMKASNFISSGQGLMVLDLDATRQPRSRWRFRRGFRKDLARFLKNWRGDPQAMEEAMSLTRNYNMQLPGE